MHTVATAWGVAAFMAVGLLFGLGLCRAVGGWFRATDDSPVPPRTAAAIAIASAGLTALLWWWEVRAGGQLPRAAGVGPAPADAGELAWRFAAHGCLFWFLAAATWIDFRQRVIPDWITVSGAILGLVGAWARPGILLPVVIEMPRSFAAPSLEPDVLAWFGGLHSGSGGPFAAAPHAAGLGLGGLIFTVWWLVCTEPPAEAVPARVASPRNGLLLAGLVGILAAWWHGGERFAALQTALVGLGVSGGLVWATRAGASRALGREAMGLGDVTLMAMAGAWLGWQACVLAFFLAAFIGLIHGVVQLSRHRENELPFGPSLCLAVVLVVVAWRPLWRMVAVHFERPGELAVVVATVVGLTAVTLFVWRHVRPVA
ncbi:MAG: prepilin peptidase [Planctomycetia bacterium]|nr:prepilin peptidase [Planctomycetia bacterium]